jgi:hypothetical protein
LSPMCKNTWQFSSASRLKILAWNITFIAEIWELSCCLQKVIVGVNFISDRETSIPVILF